MAEKKDEKLDLLLKTVWPNEGIEKIIDEALKVIQRVNEKWPPGVTRPNFPTWFPEISQHTRNLYNELEEEAHVLNIEMPLMPIVNEIWSYLSDAPIPIKRAFWLFEKEKAWGEWRQDKQTIIVSPPSNH